MIIEAAPMAGYTDHAFRTLLLEQGTPALTYTEMVSATALFHNSKKTLPLLAHSAPTALQLFGKNPEHFAHAIKFIESTPNQFVEININMGCPAPKITKNGEGSALMKNPDLAEQIIRACVAATDKPVTVKFRLGFQQPHNTAVEFARMCERAGAAKIILHGRYASQGYSGTADWNAIADVVKSVSIPVIANGDIRTRADMLKCLETTKASGVMVGRALLGAPWNAAIIAQNAPPPTQKAIRATVLSHIKLAQTHGTSFPEMKKHLLFYCNHLDHITKDDKRRLALSKDFDEAIGIMAIAT